MKNTIFTGAGVAITTPMNTDGSINYEQFAKDIDFQIENGTDAIIVCGTTGEASTMNDDEHIECIRFTVEQTKKRVPVIAGTGSNDTKYAAELSKTAEDVGADAVLVVTPYYNKTSQKGLVAHFNTIADNINVPVVLYNIPGRTGMNIAIDTYGELVKNEKIVAVKEASGNLSYVAKLIAAYGDKIDVYSGNDDQIVPMMSLGSKGVISVLSNIMPKETHEMASLCLENDFNSAAKLQLKYLELINDLFVEVNPIPIKEAMNIIGRNAGPCRMPLVSMADDNKAKLTASLKAAGLVK